MNNQPFRAALVKRFGARHYRITASGEIHVFGTMPNTNREGWFFLCRVSDRDAMTVIAG